MLPEDFRIRRADATTNPEWGVIARIWNVGDAVLGLDPNDRAALGPLLDLYPDRLTRMTMASDGTLEAVFAHDAALTVPPDARFEAWSIGGFWCPPGGFAKL